MIYKDLLITQNSYYFVHRHFLDFFEAKNSQIIFVSENKRGIYRKYFELISNFGIINSLRCIFYELFFMIILRKRKNALSFIEVKDKDLNNFLKTKILNNRFRRIISIGCPVLISTEIINMNVPIYNLHGGIIPFQRGRYSPLKSIKKGHKVLGCSLHLIDKNFDKGTIISQDFFKLKNKYKLYNYDKVLKLSADLLRDFQRGNLKILPDEIINYLRKVN